MTPDSPELESPSWSETSLSDASGYVQINLPVRLQIGAPPANNSIAEKHIFPKSVPDWSNLKVIHRNTLPPRSTFVLFDTAEDAVTRDLSKSKSMSLSGTWKFNLSKSPFDAPEKFHDPEYDAGSWGDIQVPGMWQLQGYGKGPQYVSHF